MTLLRGPLGSTDARGTLAGLVTFSNRRGRHVAGIASRPKQPRTLPQRALRVTLAGLAKNWAAISPADKATWKNYPGLQLLPPYHAYQKGNLARLKTLPNKLMDPPSWHAYPSAAYPATEDTPFASAITDQLVPGVRSATWSLFFNAYNDGWIIIFHRTETPEYGAILQNIVGLFLIPATGWQSFRIENLEPGPAKLCFNQVSRTGFPRPYTFCRFTTILP